MIKIVLKNEYIFLNKNIINFGQKNYENKRKIHEIPFNKWIEK